jgi:hypothetical protein
MKCLVVHYFRNSEGFEKAFEGLYDEWIDKWNKDQKVAASLKVGADKVLDTNKFSYKSGSFSVQLLCVVLRVQRLEVIPSDDFEFFGVEHSYDGDIMDKLAAINTLSAICSSFSKVDAQQSRCC